MATPRTILVRWARHGQNAANLSRQFSHRRLDLDLTTLGREQADRLAKQLASRLGGAIESPALFASPLRRAQQTAEIVARRLGADIETIDGLRELNVGDLDGRSDHAAWQIYESVLEGWRRGQHERRFPGGEDWHELCRRLAASLRHVAEGAGERPAVIIAHGANLRAALPGLAGVEDPGTDLDTGQFADLELTRTPTATQVRLLAWRRVDEAGTR